MSATNRGAERRPDDAYLTPAWCVRRLLDRVPLPGGDWLEPAAGEGSIMRAVNDLRDDVSWRAYEIRPEAATIIGNMFEIACYPDFLGPEMHCNSPSVIITNPPYSLASEFVARALEYRDAIVAMLLRLNWLGSSSRAHFLRCRTPDVYVLPNRPSFTPDGRTDATEYAWMVWDAERRTTGRIEILPPTPIGERRCAGE